MRTKNKCPKIIAIVLVVVFLVSATFLFLGIWEKNQGRYPEQSVADGVLVYNGQEYLRKESIETFLVLGLDKYDGVDVADSHESGVQTDFIMLLVFDNEAKQCAAVQINRDTMTKVNKLSVGGTTVVDSFTKQIALAYNYVNDDNDKIRCRNTKDSVEYLLEGVRVNHYLSLTMDAVSAGCDLVGGVEVTVLDDFTGVDDALIKGEKVNLNGDQALKYVRSRYGLKDDTNSNRMARQQQYLEAFYKKITKCMASDEDFLLRLVETMNEHVVYDSSDQRMMKIAEKFEDYEFLGIRELEGESKLGEEFVEFYPYEESIQAMLIDLFYEEK